MFVAPGQYPGVAIPVHWYLSMHTPRIPFTVHVVCAETLKFMSTGIMVENIRIMTENIRVMLEMEKGSGSELGLGGLGRSNEE
jgi:hypothetical protein